MSEIKAWAVVDKGGDVKSSWTSRPAAKAEAGYRDNYFGEDGPHVVIELTGQLPRKPETRTVWSVVDNRGIGVEVRSHDEAQSLARVFDSKFPGHRPHRIFTGTEAEVLK